MQRRTVEGFGGQKAPVKHTNGELLPLAVSAVVQQGCTVGLC